MTVAEIIFLLLGKMSLFEAITHAFGTAGTGGFGIRADSIAGYSPYIQWVITIFMLLFGINFNIYFLLLIKRTVNALKSTELWAYIAIVVACVTAISFNIYHMYDNIGTAIRHAAFQVSSIITTTGFATTDFNLWPTFSKGILLILMLVGACAGSTGGGFKVSRVMLLIKYAIRQEENMIDIKFLRENPEVVKENIKKKFQDHKLVLVDEIIELDKQSRDLTLMCDDLRMRRNSISKEIGGLMAKGLKDEANPYDYYYVIYEKK